MKYGWRWTFRIDLIICGITWTALLFLSGRKESYRVQGNAANEDSTETFAPVLLKKHAKKLRKEMRCNRYFAPQELKSDAAFTLAQTITRPLTMLVFEPIILFTAIYVSLAWSMVFFYFQAYPIIFEGKTSNAPVRAK